MKLDVVGQKHSQAVPVPLVEQRDIARNRSGRRPRVRKRTGMRVDFPKMRATPRQMAFYRVNGEAEEGGDLYQRFVEHVLQDDDTALEGGSSTKRDTAVLTAFLRINTSKGSGWAESATSVAASIGSATRTSRLRSRSSARL